MTDETKELLPCPLERLAEHLCARRPCGETPENVADWLDYSLNRCGLVVMPEQSLTRAAPEHPLAKMVREDEEMGLYDDEAVPPPLTVSPSPVTTGKHSVCSVSAARAAPDVEKLIDALATDLSFQLADGKGNIDDTGGPAFTQVRGEIDLERLAKAAIAAIEGGG